MASTNHTPNLNLNQWLATDPVIREDFNADNAKIDAAVTAKPDIVSGHYTGDGTASRTIEVGFTPTAVYLATSAGYMTTNSGCRGGLFVTGSPLRWVSSANAGEIVTGGFRVAYNTSNFCYTNISGEVYHYIAVK